MFDFEYSGTEIPQLALGLKFSCLANISSILKARNATKVEDVLYLFDDPVNAILAAIECRDAVSRLNARCRRGSPKVSIKGFGIHLGDLLFINGTDVHWGDPVNSASKLGQDLAEDGDILVSLLTHQACSA